MIPFHSSFRLGHLARFVAGLVVAGTLLTAAHAHDPYDSFSAATVFSDRVEITVTMAQSTALKLADPDRNIRGLTEEIFAHHRALFEREAKTLYLVNSVRRPLKVERATATLTEENDVSFKVVYAKPGAGLLHFHASFLVKLGEGYGGILDVSDSDNHQLGWDQLAWASPNLEITVPPAGRKPAAK